ncbi:MAG: sugar transporter [Halochromatium sp.]|nr:sugar transporter [Halochromatium sp.]
MQKTSSVKLPVQTPEGLKPMKVDVQEIDANLVIRKQQALMQAKANATPPVVEPIKHRDYRVGAGDVLTVIVWGHPDLTLPTGNFRSAEESGTVVSEDGTIFFPFVGVLKVEGKTIPQVRDLISQRLSPYIENVQVSIRVAAFRSKRIYVAGEVESPGVYAITDIPMTVVEAVNQAGGFTDNADKSRVLLNRNGELTLLDLLAVYEYGDLSQNIRLQNGDILTVADNQLNKVYILGEVKATGSLTIRNGRMTLAEALSDSGNIDMETANPYQIFVVRGGETPEIYHLSAKEPDALLLAEGFPLQRRDILFVDTADLVRWNKFISNLTPSRNFFELDTSADNLLGTGGGGGSTFNPL